MAGTAQRADRDARANERQRAARQPVIGPAPGLLEHVREFVNTLDIELGTDELDSPEALIRWLRARDLVGPAPGEATEGDLQRAIAMREGLRLVLLGHVGRTHPVPAQASDLQAAAAGLTARLQVGDDGTVQLVPGSEPGSGPGETGLAALMLIAAVAAIQGTWRRLKVCSADDCRWAFYDRSPTRSGCWCSMAVCGSRAKSRAYRSRTAVTGPDRAPARRSATR